MAQGLWVQQRLSANLKASSSGKESVKADGFLLGLRPISLRHVGLRYVSSLLATLRPVASLIATLARCLAVLAVLVAATGYGALVLIYATRHLTSASPVQTAPLYFDYSGPVASATVDLRSQLAPFPKPLNEYMFPRLAEDPVYMHLQQQLQQGLPQSSPQKEGPRLPTCTNEESGSELPAWQAVDADSIGRLLSPSQKVRISVELQLPASHLDLFQLSGELLSGKGHLLERSVRTYVAVGMPQYVRFFKQLALAPCFALGYCSDMMTVQFAMFESYVEKTQPLQGFRAVLSSRRSAYGTPPPPPVGAATVKIELQMGLLRQLLYWLRPSLGTTLVIVPAVGLLAVTASGTAIFFVVASVFLKHLAEQLPTMVPVPAPSRLLASSLMGRSLGTSSVANKSFSTSTEDLNGSRVCTGEEEEEGLEDEGSDADLAWQVVEEVDGEELYLDPSEAWDA